MIGDDGSAERKEERLVFRNSFSMHFPFARAPNVRVVVTRRGSLPIDRRGSRQRRTIGRGCAISYECPKRVSFLFLFARASSNEHRVALPARLNVTIADETWYRGLKIPRRILAATGASGYRSVRTRNDG